ncbi:hypothetical protein GCM10028798_21080 [Humibacter antri]
MRLHRRTNALGVFTAALLAIAAVAPTSAASAAGTADDAGTSTALASIDSFAPPGTTDVIEDASVSASSSYEMPTEGWAAAKLVDGVLSAPGAPDGWSTSPYDKVADSATPARVDVTANTNVAISRVVLFPRSDGSYGASFPAAYTLQLLDDSGTPVFSRALTQTSAPTAPVVIDPPTPVTARTVRLDVEQRGGPPGGDGYLVQLSELAAFGTPGVTLSIDKPALLLKTGGVDHLPFHASSATGQVPVQWSSSNSAVATVDQAGMVTGVAPGTSTITLAATGIDRTVSIPVTVKDTIERPGDKFLITAFWPVTEQYVNDQQVANLADGGIDYLQTVPTSDLTAKSTQLALAALAAKHGIQIGVADDRSSNLATMTDDQITAMANDYTDVPGVGGFYVDDEPSNAADFARAYKDIKAAAPDYYAHLNFLPSGSYGSDQAAAAAMQSWVDLVGNGDYLMYDRYPFGWTANSLDYQGFLGNMDAVRQVGLRTGAKTATYLQSVGVVNNYRRTNATEIRYEANMAMAYGYKQLSYFTWWTPTNRGENFTQAIMSPTGEKTDLYQPVQELNSEIHALGPTLMKLDAEEVYLNGQTWGRPAVPSDFFVHAPAGDDLTLSYLRDRETGRNYLMVVNNDFTKPINTTLGFDKAIDSLQTVSRKTGKPEPVAFSGGDLALHLDEGESVLYELPAGYDYDKRPTPDDVNLAAGAFATTDAVDSAAGWSAAQATDGVRFGATETNGWATPATDSSAQAHLTVDLGRAESVDRVDLYPAGNLLDYGASFPRDYRIEVSSDGKTYTTVAEKTGQGRASGASTLSFSTVTARYVRVQVLAMNETGDGYRAGLAEIEVYNDDGKTAAPPKPPSIPLPLAYSAGDDVALGRTVVVSSTTPSSFEQWGWAPKFLVDGKTDNGWTSDVGRHSSPDATEWAAVALGAPFDVNDIKLYAIGAFAVDYRVQLSADGSDWTTVASVTGDDGSTAAPRDFVLDTPVSASFVRVISSKLRSGGNSRDGTLMQLADLQVFGAPTADHTALRDLIAAAKALPESHYTLDSWRPFPAALATAQRSDDAPFPFQYQLDAAASALKGAIASLVTYPDWKATTVYRAGERVIYEDRVFVAQWYTRNQVPGASPWSAWSEVGEPVTTSQGRVARWTDSWIYGDGDLVAFNGHLWRARWWSRDDKPGTRGGPWQDLGAY